MKPFILLFAFCCLPLVAHAQTPWKLEPFLEYFGHVKNSRFGSRVKGFVGSHSNNPYNVSVASSPFDNNPTGLNFYSVRAVQDTTPLWVIPDGADVEHGDFNGDGFTDFAVWKSTNMGRSNSVSLYFGNGMGIDTAASIDLFGEQAESGFGVRLCTGDLNNDSVDDLIVSAPGYRVQATERIYGKLYGFYGGNAFSTSPATTITGSYAGAGLGSRCVSRDFNDDGYNDLAIRGLDQTNSNLIFGYLNVYFGSAAPFDTVADLTSPRSYNTIVSGLAAFDANADGKTDLLWAYSDSLTSRKSVHIHYGGADFAERFRAGPDFIIPAPFGSGEFGNEIANAGDMNGDGDEDIVIAAYSTGQENGIVFVYTAGKALDDGYDAARGQSREGNFGATADGIGDINGDGYDDIIVGAPNQPWHRSQGYFGIFLGDSRILTGVADPSTETPPSDFALLHAHPNPFSYESLIQFTLPQKAVVKIKVYDILGKEVITLLDSQRLAGQHQARWSGRSESGEIVPTGIYFIRMQAHSIAGSQLLFQHARKITVVK
ncbi:MAG: hypothetical protein DKINENOH_05415 [bacterium]|nr:hypothetical protein [bacterium]